MGRNIEEVLNSLPPERREKIERRSAELLTEYRTRQKLKEILENSEELGIDEQLMMLQLMIRLLQDFNFHAKLTVLNPEDLDNTIRQVNLTLFTSILTGFSSIADISANIHPEADKELRRLPNIIDEIVKARGEKPHSLTAPQKINLSVLCDLVEEFKGSLEVVVNLPGESPVRLPIAIQEEMMSETNVITNTTPEPPFPHAMSEFLPQLLQEIQQTPKEYWPNLLQIIRLFRESVNGDKPASALLEKQAIEITPAQQYEALSKLIQSWVDEGDEEEQTETAEYLRQVLDENR